jgi:hypothetical protein
LRPTLLAFLHVRGDQTVFENLKSAPDLAASIRSFVPYQPVGLSKL